MRKIHLFLIIGALVVLPFQVVGAETRTADQDITPNQTWHEIETPALDQGVEILDQVQQESDYGMFFDSVYVRWQEFIPTLTNFTSLDILINKNGSPGNLIVEVRELDGTVLGHQEVLPGSIPSGPASWLHITFSQFMITPGTKYRIYVYSDTESTSPDDRYFWDGVMESSYCPKCESDVSGGIAGYAYGFKTYGVGIRRVTVADFDGDRNTDISVYRPSNGNWYIMGHSPVSWGLPGDLPVPGQYLHSGNNSAAVFRPSNGKWYVWGMSPVSWGQTGDIPVPMDYTGDGLTDMVVLRPSTGRWYIPGWGNHSWYHSGDIPVPCDYDGDYADEIAVFRPSNGKWYVMGESPVAWAHSGDIPVPADYNGDGVCDIAVYRPSNGNWYVKGQGSTSWGYPDDIPVPGDYDGCGDAEIAVLRPSNGKWYIQGMGNFSWYHAGDYPLPVRDTNADGDPYQ